MSDPTSEADEQLDTTSGDRDPLSTDDGLAEASEGIPQIEDRDSDGDGVPDPFDGQNPVTADGLEVDQDGNDPLAGADDDEGEDGEVA